MFYIDRVGNNEGKSAKTQIDKKEEELASEDSLEHKIYCDLCYLLQEEPEVSNHLRLFGHASASVYSINKYCESAFPSGAHLICAEKYSTDLPLTESSILCVCTYCKKAPCISARPLQIYAHHWDTHVGKSNKGSCIIYEKHGDVSRIDIPSGLLSSCYKDSMYPCLTCHTQFSKPGQVISHMTEAQHTILQKYWNPENSQKTLKIIKCESCDLEDMVFTSPSLLLYHLVKVHGRLLSEDNSNTDNILLSVLKYKSHRDVPKFSDKDYKKVVMTTHLGRFNESTKKKTDPAYVKSKEINSELRSEGPSTSKRSKLEGNDHSLKMKGRLCQQYCCDCCLVALSTELKVSTNHMAAFGHPSVSMYNTKVNPITQDCEVLSVHNYGAQQNVAHNYRSLLFKCSVSGCSFISPDPIICSIHMNILHYQDREPKCVKVYRQQNTVTYSLQCKKSGTVTCPTCQVEFSRLTELINHMAGTKHNTMIEKANHLRDVARCSQCREDNPKSIFITESSLLAHLIKHGRQIDKSELKFTVTSFSYDADSDRSPVLFDSDWLKHQVTVNIIKQLISGPHSGRVEAKKYRAVLKKLKEERGT